jgi:hypothetical protein
MVVAVLVAATAIAVVVVVVNRATSTSSHSTSSASGTPAPTASGVPAAQTVAAGPAPVIAAAGDISCDSPAQTTGHTCAQGMTASEITSDPKLAAVLALGDLQYECGDSVYFERYYGTTWGRFRARTYPAVGNHEYLTTRGKSKCASSTNVSGKGYFDYWNGTGSATGRAGNRSQGYYSFDVGSWHLISLNSNCSRAGGCDIGSPQATWLANDLAAHRNRCTLAYWHHPRFSSGEHGDDLAVAPLWQLLSTAGADIVLNGHDHDYERFAPQTPSGAADPATGIREFVVGTGGKSHYRFTKPAEPNSQVRNGDTFGVLELTLHPTGYDWRFVPVAGGTFTDSGSGTCH